MLIIRRPDILSRRRLAVTVAYIVRSLYRKIVMQVNA